MIDAATADAIASRVNCYGIGAWPAGQPQCRTARWLGGRPSARAGRSAQHGLRLTLYARDALGRPDWADSLVLERAEFQAGQASLPFGLDAQVETFASAAAKLSTDTAGGGGRTSYFPPDARVVELTFNLGGSCPSTWWNLRCS